MGSMIFKWLLLLSIVYLVNSKSISRVENEEERGLAEEGLRTGKDFRFFWNIPVSKCKEKGAPLDLTKYDVIFNEGQTFLGDKVNVWYKFGKWPEFKDGVSHNGGIPMAGNLSAHKEAWVRLLHEKLGSDFSGVSVLDFEKYLPYYDSNLREYKIPSRQWVADNIPGFSNASSFKELQDEAMRIWDKVALPYFVDLITLQTELHPNALVGYYKFPYCRNFYAPFDTCAPKIMKCNDFLEDSIFSKSTALFPSIYLKEDYGHGYHKYITTRLAETKRVNKKNLPVFPYYWYRFREGKFLPKEVVLKVFATVKKESDGMILWGFKKDIDTKEKCTIFQEYMDNILGPAMKCVKLLTEEQITMLTQNDPSVPGDKEVIKNIWDEVCVETP